MLLILEDQRPFHPGVPQHRLTQGRKRDCHELQTEKTLVSPPVKHPPGNAQISIRIKTEMPSRLSVINFLTPRILLYNLKAALPRGSESPKMFTRNWVGRFSPICKAL